METSSEILPMKLSETNRRVPMARPGFGCKGRRINLLTNHFRVESSKNDGYFYRYAVSIYSNWKSVDAKGIFRKVLDRLSKKYEAELPHESFAYDGGKSIYTFSSLPRALCFGSFPETSIFDVERVCHTIYFGSFPSALSFYTSESPIYKVFLSYAEKIPIRDIFGYENCQEAIRVLHTILRQHAAKRGYTLVQQSFFHKEASDFLAIGDGVVGRKGFHSSFRPTIGGLSLNIGLSTKTFVKPGPVLDFLLESQSVSASQIDWNKAETMLQNIRIKVTTSSLEYKIIGFSDQTCRTQTFLMKQKNKDEPIEISVYKYFADFQNKKLSYSENLPCIKAGSPKRPVLLPIEVCTLLPLQRYTKSLTHSQRTNFVKKSCQNPEEMMEGLTNALNRSNYNDNDGLLRKCGISVINEFTKVEGRILEPPKLTVGGTETIIPRDGRWNFNDWTFQQPVRIERWIIVNFSATFSDVPTLTQHLITGAKRKGMLLKDPIECCTESRDHSHRTAANRVGVMFEKIKRKHNLTNLEFILCILPTKKNSDLYGPWKKKSLSDLGIVTQCIVPTQPIKDEYITNVLLKINAKMGGTNSLLSIEQTKSIPLISNVSTMIIGMDVSHGSPGQNVPSIAAVVSSRAWPFISRYMAVVRTQSPRTEMIDALCKKRPDNSDEGIFRELLEDFKNSSNMRPEQIIIFRDGVGDSQFIQVLNIELEQIIQACNLFDDAWSPKFLVIIAQKNHHTRFFQVHGKSKNVLPGTVVDDGVCHPRNNDFYMCAHKANIGTSRPVHYHVLHDDIGCSADQLQELVHNLSYVYQRSTTSVSLVAPVYYAHHAAAQVSKFDNFDNNDSNVPELPRLHPNVRTSMFFC